MAWVRCNVARVVTRCSRGLKGVMPEPHGLSCQLAFLLEILSAFPAISAREAYDPLFTATDVTVLRSYGVEVLSDNDDGRRPLSLPSLVFMPHLEVRHVNGMRFDNGWHCFAETLSRQLF